MTAAMVVASILLVGLAAQADHTPPDATYTSTPGDGSNEGPFWDGYFNLAFGSCRKINESAGSAFVMPDPPSGEVWYALVVKQGSPSSNNGPDNFIYLNPVAGHSYPSIGNQAPGYSHLIVCSVPEPQDTTTTTLDDTTTTTGDNTTTTQARQTTTTQAQVIPTTTPNIPDEVLGTTITAAPTTIAVEVTSESLPFTGFENGTTGLVALVLVGLGVMLLVGTQVVRDGRHSAKTKS